VHAGDTYVYDVAASDPDGQALAFTLATSPPWLSLSGASSGGVRLEGVPAATDIGSASVTLRVSDGEAAVDQAFDVQVVSASPTEVTSANDSGPGSLRQVVADAPAGATITFTDGLSSIFVATEIVIERSVRIHGPGMSGLVLQGLSARFFGIRDSTAIVEISGLSMKDGQSDDRGGAIYNEGTLLLKDVSLRGFRAFTSGGAVYNGGALTVEASQFGSNRAQEAGGSIDNHGTLTVIDSEFDGHNASEGGAIRNAGEATIERSTFLHNISASGPSSRGGTILNLGTLKVVDCSFGQSLTTGDGGAIYSSGTATVSYSRFDGNYAEVSGGAIFTSGTLAVSTSDISGNSSQVNGGAISAAGSTTLRHITFAGNQTGVGASAVHAWDPVTMGNTLFAGFGSTSYVFGTIVSEGYLLTEDVIRLGNSLADATMTGDQTGNQIDVADARLSGGVPADGSPALDSGSCSGTTQDVLRLPRPVDFANAPDLDDGCDIGAYERQN